MINIQLRSHTLLQKAAFVAALLCSTATVIHAQPQKVIQKKFIEVGWDKPYPATLREHLTQMEQTPFDGAGIRVVGRDDDGKRIEMQRTASSRHWKQEWFQSSVDNLKAVHSDKLTDNFIMLGASPESKDLAVGWFDDKGWKEIVNHWRIAAWIAKEGGLKGIMFDPEAYSPYAIFDYKSQPENEKYTSKEYQEKVRQRGKEIIQAVAEVDPNLVIFTFFMNSVQMPRADLGDAHITLGNNRYSLYPAFINGWLDAAPPTMIFVDGCENAYHYNSWLQYLQAANDIRTRALSLVAPENRSRYTAQVQVGSAIYLDAYTNPSTSAWYIDPKGAKPVERLQTNAAWATRTVDQYVWFYGEKRRWWPTASSSVTSENWSDALPGITTALLSVTHPERVADEDWTKLKKQKDGINLLQNGDFNARDKISHWSTWQTKVSQGTFAWDPSITRRDTADNGSVKITNVKYGSVYQSINVSPGERYLIHAWTRHSVKNSGWIAIQWISSKPEKELEKQSIILMRSASPSDNGWYEVSGVLTVPNGAEQLRVLLDTANQSPRDSVWFDDVNLYKLGVSLKR